MTANTDFDCKLKCGLIDDVLTIVNFEGIITGEQMTVGGFDLIMNKGLYVMKSPYSQSKTNLGWKNNREHNYKHLLKQFFMRKKGYSENNRGSNNVSSLHEQKQNGKGVNVNLEQVYKKQKLLPNFYYKQKPLEQIDESIRGFLKK